MNLDLRKVNSSAVEVSWSPPLSANGIILEYQLFYISYDKHKIEEKTQKVNYISSLFSVVTIVYFLNDTPRLHTCYQFNHKKL